MRAEHTLDHAAVSCEPLQRSAHDGDAESEPGRRFGRGERPVGAGVPGNKITQGVSDRFDKRQRHAHGQRNTEGITQPGRILDCGVLFDAANVDLDGAVGPQQRGQVRSSVDGSYRRRRSALCGHGLQPGGYLVRGQRPEEAQQIGDAFHAAYLPVRRKPLQFPFRGVDDLGVEELAQLDPAEELVEQGRIQRQRGGTALGKRGIALIQELGDVAEQQGLRER